jgi:hypothetical protein
MEIFRARVFKDEADVHWVCNVELASVEDYATFNQDDPFTLSVFGELFEFIVDSKELTRNSPANVTAVINGISPTALKDFPRAEPYSVTHDVAVMAQVAAETALGESIDWQMVDWLIPAYRLVAENASPLEFAKLIVEAAGGVLESKIDGTFLARHKYPVSPVDYPEIVADHTFAESDKILSVTEQFVPGKIVNKIRILDQDTNFNDVIEFIADPDDPLQGDLNVYPGPWRTTVQLLTTSPTAVITLTPYDPLEQTRLITDTEDDELGELVEILNSEGQTTYPVDSIDSVVWISNTLGTVSAEPGSNTIRTSSTTEGYGLLRIKYNTRFLRYRAVSNEALPAQFILEDVG